MSIYEFNGMAGGIEENSVSATTTAGLPFVVIALLRLEFLDLLSRDADRAVDGNTGAGEQSGQQVTLITLNIGEEASRFDGTAALGHFGRNPRGSDWGGDWDVRLGEAPGSIPSRNCPRNRARLGYPHASRVGRELILHILNPLVALSASRKHPRLVRNAIALVPFLKEQQVL
ncbi:MAG TPA: hypothetical protein VL285_03330, partial [Bryobacteraceae bacterium]|nr:hypothetical protein [Bryobacteraceae bacterium]